MRITSAAITLIVGSLSAMPVLADSVAITSGNGRTSVVTGNGQPCRVETGRSGNSTTVTTGNGGATASTTVAPGGNGSSVAVGSGSSGGCTITHNGK